MSNLAAIDAKFWATLVENPWTIVVHLLDILIVAYFIYRLIKALAGTKIMSLIQGVIFFIILKFVAEWIGFTTITYLMNQVITYGVIACVVIFAPEIRSGLEKFGRSTQVFSQTQQVSDEEKLVEALVKSVAYMSPRKIGALISIERTQTLQEYISTGIPLDADISSQLLINIFIPNTPLHDGAVIISGNKIATACSYLPLSESMAISKKFGTRHRAAIGLSENSDALTIVVSEETGGISITSKGEFLHDLTKENFEAILRTHLITKVEEEEHWYQKFWRKKK
ncbi:diadenylate cyclase CdaA [Streptococcus infantarius]|jgi:diadenylate cyclase|uniref:diadenylate cyclase CdaA n=1 Tax=Streptococcus infantarius TaxID=102684 RepID=UPI00208F4E7D|nr:diadenylate cyclase CdaA [Streptococcus infantarius]MCO4470514.1 TIGR00159 family protein [Streptococcus infantarius subsp. infantarius]MCO4471898.1 TIGR00159 family protein [Streptococcus infantarius subsp. infantarius]MCO4474990.1 TIGR00159 family protein [Streptococcus infantarius subsp. infantarius]MCO4478136.1 TIGR00159 family protein [Streptococcus infantarius subsp. infantarius]MCO4480195.1 TIGR00159 family protein [Streptococcus infantarius subsp. infantarius]